MSIPYDGQSTTQSIPGLSGENTANGVGVKGQGDPGVWGEGSTGGGEGVHGISHTGFAGVGGYNDNAQGGPGVWGEGGTGGGEGVHGISHTGFAGVGGYNDNAQGGPGVWGEGGTGGGEGVHGISHSTWAGVAGINLNPQGGPGVWGEGGTGGGEGVHGISHSTWAGVAGINESTGAGVYGKSAQGDAGHFDGNVTITGDVVLTGADCAEEFDILETTNVEPGTVMVLDQDGALQPSQQAYDKRVAGVISGAGTYKPGIVLDKQQSSENRMPLALVGKVYCKVDAQYASIQVGDLLTTSLTPGHAMKASDPLSAFGAVIGKALRPLKEGQGLIPILIALQ